MYTKLVLAVALLAACFSGSNAACTLATGDVNTLNYALSLEHLESAFYTQLVNKYTSAQFQSAGFSATDYSYVQMVQAHEAEHVTFLTTTLTNAGCTAVSACQYNFTNALSSIPQALATAQVLEATGVSAYDGAFNTIYDPTIRQAAAAIAAIEARHTSYLSTLVNVDPFPNITDVPLTALQVEAIAAQFFVNASACTGLPASNLPVLSYTYFNVTNIGNPYNGPGCQIYSGDLTTLNFALSLEHLEATFYKTALENSTLIAALNNSQYNDTLPYLELISGHETAHVTFLTSVQNSYGCSSSVAPQCVYNFTNAFSSAANFIATAAALEGVGVGAYVGASNTIRDAQIRQAAATIETVEARHSAYLQVQLGQSPWPSLTNYDGNTPLTTAQVLAAASPFIVSCPNGYNISALNPQVVSNLDANQVTTGVTTASLTTASTTASLTTASTTARVTTSSTTGNSASTVAYTVSLVLAAIVATLAF